MDEDIRLALADIRQQVRDGFSDVSKRIDQMVTRGEHTATVERLDAQHATLRRDFDAHERRTEQIIKDNRAADEAIRAEVKRELNEFSTQARWSVGIAVTLAGFVFGLISWAINIF